MCACPKKPESKIRPEPPRVKIEPEPDQFIDSYESFAARDLVSLEELRRTCGQMPCDNNYTQTFGSDSEET